MRAWSSPCRPCRTWLAVECQAMDTENIDDPFKHAKVGNKVIVGGRSMTVFSDSKEA